MVNKKNKFWFLIDTSLYSNLYKQKRGWIKVVEAVVAILIILGVILVILNKGSIQKEDISEKVYKAEHLILREIELNESLREEVLNATQLPVDWLAFNSTRLTGVQNKIIEKTPNYLECEGRVCWLNQTCVIEDRYKDRDVYTKAISITTTLNVYSPRQLKLFCWVK